MNDLDNLFRQEAGLSPNTNRNNPFNEAMKDASTVPSLSSYSSTGTNGGSNNNSTLTSAPMKKTLNQLINEKAIHSYLHANSNSTVFTTSTGENNQQQSSSSSSEWWNITKLPPLPSSEDKNKNVAFLPPNTNHENSSQPLSKLAPSNVIHTTKGLPLHPKLCSSNSVLINPANGPSINARGNGSLTRTFTNNFDSESTAEGFPTVNERRVLSQSSPRNLTNHNSTDRISDRLSNGTENDNQSTRSKSYASTFSSAYLTDSSTVDSTSAGSMANNGSNQTYTQYADRMEGRLFMRHVTNFFIKRWKERYVSLNISKGIIRVWMDKSAMLRGEECTAILQLSTTMALSPMKVATNTGNGNPSRIFYRHIADVNNIIPSELLSKNHNSGNGNNSISALHIAEATKQGTRIFKFGCGNQKDFEVWTKVFRSSIEALIRLEKTIIETHDALDIGNRMNGTDLMKLALRSPSMTTTAPKATNHGTSSTFHRPSASFDDTTTTGTDNDTRDNFLDSSVAYDHTNTSSYISDNRAQSIATRPFTSSSDSSSTVKLFVQLLDRSPLDITIARTATVHDACIRLRELLRLEADADHSLYLRSQDSRNRDNFTILPDILMIDNVDSMIRNGNNSASSSSNSTENYSLVYKRRIYVSSSVASVTDSGNTNTSSSYRNDKIPIVWNQDFFTNPFHSSASTNDPQFPSSISLPSSESSAETSTATNDTVLSSILDAAQIEADAATSANEGAVRIEYADAVYNVTNGNYFLSLEQALVLAGLQFVTLSATKLSLPTASESTDGKASSLPPNLLRFYKQNVSTVLSTESTNEFYANQATIASAAKEDMTTVLSRYHHQAKTYTNNNPLQAQKLYLKAVRTLPEYGSNFYFGELARHLAPGNLGTGSRSADPTPPWAENITTLTNHPTNPPEKVSILIGMNHRGIFMRPIPDPAIIGNGGLESSSLSTRLSYTKYRCGWSLHPIHYIEVWGVKKTRPCFTYRVRENQLVNIEITSPQFKELASGLHMVVFALMAQREGKLRTRSREILSTVPLATLTKEKNKEAKQKAVADLPTGWVEIMDPATGSIVFWHTVSKRTVFTRPTATDDPESSPAL